MTGLALRLGLALLLLWPAAGGALAHALQPAFVDLAAQGGQVWRVTWRVPDVNGGPMPLRLVLPQGCTPRSAGALQFDGLAHVARWRAQCTEGVAGGTIRVEGLEGTQTDVLVRFDLGGGLTGSLRLTPGQTEAQLPTTPARAEVLASYVTMGIDHILGGTDHLLFVFALLLLVPGLRRLAGAITAFTLAHSLSLVAATLGWLVVPGPPVEAVIALSILFLAAELARPAGQGGSVLVRRPWLASFGFGLLHGLGFAGALVEIGLPQGEVPLALFGFNLGVEIGQLIFVAAVLLLAALLRLMMQAMRPGLWGQLAGPGAGGRRVLAYGIGTVSAFWLLVRLAAF